MIGDGPTLHHRLDEVAGARPDTALTFPSADERTTLGELAEDSRRVASGLRANGVAEGSVVGILQPNEPGFLVTLFALSRLGAVAAPLPLPASARQLDAYRERLVGVLGSAPFGHVVTTKGIGDLLAAHVPQGSRPVQWLAVETLGHDAAIRGSASDAEAVAILQFTSGSTSSPKGVPLRHRNIIAGLTAITDGIEIGPGDVGAFWIPLFHDMGLFGTMAAVMNGRPMHIWSPTDFIRNPRAWLRQMAELRATVSAGPNFFYQYLVDYVRDDELEGLDLSHWRIAFNGAEYISAATVQRFLDHFAPVGFSPTAMFPVYGMAEATLAVTFPPLGTAPTIDRVDRRLLAGERRAVPTGGDDEAESRAVVGVGERVKGLELRIAGEAGDPLGERAVGEIQVRGEPVMEGYLGGSGEEFTDSGWYRTGDLGYMVGEQLFVTGRSKEMIAVRGANFYAEDVEDAVRDVPGIHKGRCVAFAVEGEERIGILAETVLRDDAERAALCESIKQAIAVFAPEIAGANDVRLVARGHIPRTSSGKYRRLAAAQETAGPTN